MTNPKQPTKKQKRILHLLSAVIPFIILGVAFILHDIYPFGDRQILVTDFWHQYFPFLSDHWHRLREGGSFLWSWRAGGGHDYLAHFAYYLASPLNFLIVLFPHEYLREVLTVFVLIKVAFSGFFMSLFLSKALKRYDILLPVFSAFYALCAFTLGYYWNIMWFDTIALLPLVMLGVYALVTEGKYRLYIGSLAVAIMANFYIGIFICIAVAIMFFIQSYVAKLSRREFLQRVLTIGIATIIALGIASIILLPTYSALQNSARAETRFPNFRVYNSFASVLGNFIAFTPPTSLDGLPNLYSGLLSVILIPIFVLSKKISIREKVAYLTLLIFLILSVNINILNFIWNGFTATNMLPFRFSFIASFVVVVMAYKAYTVMDEVTKKDVIAIGIAAVFFHLMAMLGEQESTYINRSVILSVVYLALFAFAAFKKHLFLFKHAMLLVILIELSLAAYGGVSAVRTTTRTNFPLDYDYVQQLLDHREMSETDFFRTELTRERTLNAPSAFGFDGISLFSSFANVRMTEFVEGLGLTGWPTGNRFTYRATTPLNAAFLNIRYIIVRYDHRLGDGHFWEAVAEEHGNGLSRNLYHLPFGFMVHEDIVHYTGNPDNPFLAQNQLFSLATGIDESLFTLMNVIHVGHYNYDVYIEEFGRYNFYLREGVDNGMFRFNYQIPILPEQEPLVPVYAFFNFPNTNHVRVVRSDGYVLQTVYTRRPHIFSAAAVAQDDIISFEADSEVESGRGTIYVAILDQALFRRGFELLAAETLNLTYFSDTRFRGEIVVSEPRILYTSLPYAGNWRVFVNGVEEDIIAIGGAMAGVRLPSGTHVVEFRYHNQAVNLGFAISAVSLVLYAILHGLYLKGIDIFDVLFNKIFSSEEQEYKANVILLGTVTILFNWMIYIFVIQALNTAILPTNFFALVVTATFNFILYKLWIFKDRSWDQEVLARQISEFTKAQSLIALFDLVGMPVLFFVGLNEATFGIAGFEAKLVITGVVIIANIALKKKINLTSSSEIVEEPESPEVDKESIDESTESFEDDKAIESSEADEELIDESTESIEDDKMTELTVTDIEAFDESTESIEDDKMTESTVTDIEAFDEFIESFEESIEAFDEPLESTDEDIKS